MSGVSLQHRGSFIKTTQTYSPHPVTSDPSRTGVVLLNTYAILKLLIYHYANFHSGVVESSTRLFDLHNFTNINNIYMYILYIMYICMHL